MSVYERVRCDLSVINIENMASNGDNTRINPIKACEEIQKFRIKVEFSIIFEGSILLISNIIYIHVLYLW